LDLLEKKGVRLNHPVILDALADSGDLVDADYQCSAVTFTGY